MTDFTIGTKAPDFTLGDFTLSKTLQKGPILLTFYKKTCPTCQFTYPFFERIHQHYTGSNFQVIGIGQDPETDEFSTKYGVTFPMISDTPSYDVSKKYHLVYVPTAFLITPDQNITYVSAGFSKEDLLNLTKQLSQQTKKNLLDPFKEVTVPNFKAG